MHYFVTKEDNTARVFSGHPPLKMLIGWSSSIGIRHFRKNLEASTAKKPKWYDCLQIGPLEILIGLQYTMVIRHYARRILEIPTGNILSIVRDISCDFCPLDIQCSLLIRQQNSGCFFHQTKSIRTIQHHLSMLRHPADCMHAVL